MAQRRMFTLTIVDSDAFLEMPPTSQNLYFHLAMRADDDGFVGNPKKIMRMVNSGEDDMKVIIAKRFVLPFESGVCVIKHWRMHNYIQNDRYKPTVYLEEKSGLKIKENGSYTDRIEDVSRVDTQVRLGKVSIGKESQRPRKRGMGDISRYSQLGAEVIKAFEVVDPKNKNYYSNTSQRAAADFLVNEYGLEEVKKRISVLPKTNKIPYFPTITTPVQLRDKWVQLQDAADRKKSEAATGGRGFIN